jgi:hypothetical protein
MLRTLALAGSILVLSSAAAGAASSARPFLATTATARCTAGAKPALVGGTFTCLKAGMTCSLSHQDDYGRSGFLCRSGRLRAKPAPSPKLAPTGAGSSRADPVVLGKPGSLGNGWSVTVTAVNPDATSAILAADPTNKPPLDGFQYVLVSVSATYNGAGSSHLTPATSFHAMGASGYPHSTSNSYCGTLPAPSLDAANPLVFKGGTISGYAACWMVSKGDISSLELYYQPLFGTTQVWFALH